MDTSSGAEETLLDRLSRPSLAPGDVIDRVELKQRLGLESDELAARLLTQLGGHRDAGVPREALADAVRALIEGSATDKLRFCFDLHDEDGDGRIDRGELLRMLHISLVENRLAFGDGMVEALADALFERADESRDGHVDFEEFRRALEHYPGVLEHMTLGDLRWLGLGTSAPPPPVASRARTFARGLRSRRTWTALLLVYALATAALFVEAFLRYRADGAPILIQLARGCGAALNLHAALILVPMCRWTLTLLGRTPLGRVLVDDHVGFHRLVGNVALALGLGHGVAHGLNAISGPGLGALATWAGGTGLALLAVHLVMGAFAQDRIRRSGYFEIFWLTHRLYPAWVVLMLVHGPSAWMWMIGPLAWFVLDRFVARRPQRTIATAVEVLSSGVTKLSIVRPRDFEHDPADYVFVRIPAVARGEWHPFTISSAEQSDALTLHVRSSGNWTSALHRLAKARREGDAPLEVWLDGPYGTPSTHAFESRFVVMVAAGIGVTPFASVLASMRERLKRGHGLSVEKVYFVWVCREQESFEWFSGELGRLERAAETGPKGARFDVRIFMDAGDRDLKSSVLRVAMDSLYATVQADLVTGLRSRTTLGRPDWDALFSELAAAHAPETVDCFFCGPDGLATIVEDACARHGLGFRQEHF